MGVIISALQGGRVAEPKRHDNHQSGAPTPNATNSFWLKEPSQILLQHRTTPELPKSADVAIIGSGISGAFAARKLAALSPHASIVMIEAREVCSGATGRNGGHCQPKYYSKPIHLARFELANYEYLRDLIEMEKVQCEWRQVVGCHAYMNEEMLQEAIRGVEQLRLDDPKLGALVGYTTDKIKLEAMRLSPNVKGAITEDFAASLWPYKLVAFVIEQLLKARPAMGSGSFNLQTNTAVNHLQHIDGEGWNVDTSRGILNAKQVLLCTNGYTSHLLPAFSELITPVRGQMTALQAPLALRRERALAEHYSYAFLGNGGSHTEQKDEYLIQRPTDQQSGELMFGGGRRYASMGGIGVSDDSEIDQTTSRFLHTALHDVLDIRKEHEKLSPSYEWSGIMGFSRDNMPWVGAVPNSLGGGAGLWLCAGFTGHGMPNAALSAEAVVHEMTGSKKLIKTQLPPEYCISGHRAEEAFKHPKPTAAKINGAIGAADA